MPGQQMMTELTSVQNHIIKFVFDLGMYGELCNCTPDDPEYLECGIIICLILKKYILASRQFKDALARHGAPLDSVVFIK